MDSKTKQFKAFGKEFTRDEAEELIYRDKLGQIIHAGDYYFLKDIIMYGWEGITRLADQDLQEELDELIESNVMDLGQERW